MRQTLAASAACVALAACATPAPPAFSQPAPEPAPQTAGPPAAAADADDVGAVRRMLMGLADRVVEVRRETNGPGWFLSGLELWERPHGTSRNNICAASVHRMLVRDIGEQAQFRPDAPFTAGASASAIYSDTRYHALGPVTGEQGRTNDPACAALTAASGFFSARTDGDAYDALQTLDYAVRFAREPRPGVFVTAECTSFAQPCRDALAVLKAVDLRRIVSAERVSCAVDQRGCWRYALSRIEGLPPSPVSILMEGSGRRMRAIITQQQPPIS